MSTVMAPASSPGDQSAGVQFLSIRTAAIACSVCEMTIRRMIRSGRLRVDRIGRKVLICPNDLRAAIQSKANGQSAPETVGSAN